jgi:hypothetical protein
VGAQPVVAEDEVRVAVRFEVNNSGVLREIAEQQPAADLQGLGFRV